jgi:Aldo/keto reductase family
LRPGMDQRCLDPIRPNRLVLPECAHHGGKDQYGRAARGGIGGNGALLVGQTGGLPDRSPPAIARKHTTSVARVALAWMLSKGFVTSILIGAKTIDQLNDNLA